MNRLLLIIPLCIALASCDNAPTQPSHDEEQQALSLFKTKMDEGNKLAPFSYSNLTLRPDSGFKNSVISGWVCGDAEMTHSQGTFHFKLRGHVLKDGSRSVVDDLAALPVNTGVAEHDTLYEQHCK